MATVFGALSPRSSTRMLPSSVSISAASFVGFFFELDHRLLDGRYQRSVERLRAVAVLHLVEDLDLPRRRRIVGFHRVDLDDPLPRVVARLGFLRRGAQTALQAVGALHHNPARVDLLREIPVARLDLNGNRRVEAMDRSPSIRERSARDSAVTRAAPPEGAPRARGSWESWEFSWQGYGARVGKWILGSRFFSSPWACPLPTHRSPCRSCRPSRPSLTIARSLPGTLKSGSLG